MAEAIDVAIRLIGLGAAEAEPDYLSHLRLQKLLYYAQGWHLGICGCPLFRDRIEAWAHGPVVRSVYPKFAQFGDRSIEPRLIEDIEFQDSLSSEDSEHINALWDAYKGYSAISLWQMTHSEEPWISARKGCAPGDRCENEITPDSMRAFFARSKNERNQRVKGSTAKPRKQTRR